MTLEEWIRGTGTVNDEYLSQRATFAFDIFYSFYLAFNAYYSTESKKELFQEYCKKDLSLEEYDSIMVLGGVFLSVGKIESVLIESLESLIGLTTFAGNEDIDPALLWQSATLFGFYSRLSKENIIYNIDLEKLHAIDIILAKLAREIGRQESYMVLEGYRTDDIKKRTIKSATTQQKAKKARKQKAIELFFKLDPKNRNQPKPYLVARLIQKKWDPTVPNEKAPSRETIISYLREAKVID